MHHHHSRSIITEDATNIFYSQVILELAFLLVILYLFYAELSGRTPRAADAQMLWKPWDGPISVSPW